MSRIALYRKYRSRTLKDLVGQEHITKTLENAIKNNAVSHGYLFTGPHGVGKTSTARIIAHAVNQIDYDELAPSPIDIIEIDAASNRRIDEIRDLRETIHITPTELSYKVYIIDEVHMLTKEAFNALLKTLEEPPAHAIFILATTEAHKLPATIVSRTQQFVFRPVERALMVKHLAYIAAQEDIDLDPAALEIVAEQSSGSFRDAISLLDQISQSSEGHITVKDVQNSLGVIGDHALTIIDESIRSGKISMLLKTLGEIIHKGTPPATIALQYARYLRQQLMEGQTSTSDHLQMIEVIQDLLRVPRSSHPHIQLEITLTKAALSPDKQPEVSSPQEEQPPKNPTPTPKQAHRPDKPPATPISDSAPKSPPSPRLSKTENWDDVLRYTKTAAPSLYAALRQADVVVEDDEVVVGFKFALHLRKAKRSQRSVDLKNLVQQVFGERTLSLVHGAPEAAKAKTKKTPTRKSTSSATAKPDTITEINSLLGGEIVNLS